MNCSHSHRAAVLQLQDEATKATGRADRGEQVGGEQVFPPPEGSTVKPTPHPHHSQSSRDGAGISKLFKSCLPTMKHRGVGTTPASSEIRASHTKLVLRAYSLRIVFVTLTPLCIFYRTNTTGCRMAVM